MVSADITINPSVLELSGNPTAQALAQALAVGSFLLSSAPGRICSGQAFPISSLPISGVYRQGSPPFPERNPVS